MKLRYARHTNNIQAIIYFYTQVIGLEILGSFENHSDYDGVFLGLPNLDWHLEFTTSLELAKHQADQDDLIVLYLSSEDELNAILNDAKYHGFKPVRSKNPYWQKNGIEIKDPDNFGVVLCVKQLELKSEDVFTRLLSKNEICTWDQLLHKIRRIPYGRTSNRSDLELVLKENQGTCSTKHAFVKQVADLNGIKGVDLILGLYKMNEKNTKGIGSHVRISGLCYIPEAHCYLKINGKRLDITNIESDIRDIRTEIILEEKIEPHQIGQFKLDLHKAYIKSWREQMKIQMPFEEIWALREKCIAELAKA